MEDNLRSMGELRGRPRSEIVGRLGEPTNVRYEGELRLLEWARAGALGALRVVLVFDSSDTCGGLVDRVEDSPDAAFYESLLNRPAEKPKPAPAVNWNIGVWFPIDIGPVYALPGGQPPEACTRHQRRVHPLTGPLRYQPLPEGCFS